MGQGCRISWSLPYQIFSLGAAVVHLKKMGQNKKRKNGRLSTNLSLRYFNTALIRLTSNNYAHFFFWPFKLKRKILVKEKSKEWAEGAISFRYCLEWRRATKTLCGRFLRCSSTLWPILLYDEATPQLSPRRVIDNAVARTAWLLNDFHLSTPPPCCSISFFFFFFSLVWILRPPTTRHLTTPIRSAATPSSECVVLDWRNMWTKCVMSSPIFKSWLVPSTPDFFKQIFLVFVFTFSLKIAISF